MSVYTGNFNYKETFHLESGEQLDGFTLRYQTWGNLNDKKDNVIWVVHALTANSNPFEWWPHVVAEGGSIDPNDHFIVCANVLGSPYGSTSPLSINPKTAKTYYHEFPKLTIRDLAKTYELLAHFLGITSIKLLVGASMGGQQALEWTYSSSLSIKHLVLLATNSKHSPYGIAFNASQRLAIEADHTWKMDHPNAGKSGLLAARAIAMISYRSRFGYNTTQAEQSDEKINQFRADSYQKYQGKKLADRFNAFSYYHFTQAMDSHNIGRGRGGTDSALQRIESNVTIIAIDSDILFTVEESQYMAFNIPNSTLYIISSDYGHDGFLIEHEKINKIISKVLKVEQKKNTLHLEL